MDNEVDIKNTPQPVENQSAEQKNQQTLWTVIRLAIGVGIIALILSAIDLDELRETFSRVRLEYVVIQFLMVAGVLVVSALRWGHLLSVQGIHVKRWTLFKYYLKMQFFSTVLPGFFASDIVRLHGIRQETRQTAVGMSSILFERITGLLVLAGMGVIAAFWTPELDEYPAVRLLMVLLFLATVSVFVLILYPFFLKFFYRFIRWQRLRGFLERFEEASVLYRQHPRAMLGTIGFSALIQVISLIAFYVQILAFGVEVRWVAAIAIAPIITVSMMIPISPGALGLQEGLYIVMMQTLGISAEDALAMSFLSRLVGIAAGLWGGVVYAFDK